MSKSIPVYERDLPRMLLAIGWTGLLAGTLDISAAITKFYLMGGKAPIRIFWYIGSAVFGPSAYSGGWPMAACGLAMHYAVAYTFTAIFFSLYSRVPILGRRPVLSGIAYGAVVWVIMNLIVVPLSRTAKYPFNPGRSSIEVGILIAGIGLPISLCANRYFKHRRSI